MPPPTNDKHHACNHIDNCITYDMAMDRRKQGQDEGKQGGQRHKGTPTHLTCTATTPCHFMICNTTSIDMCSAVTRLQGGRTMGAGMVLTLWTCIISVPHT